MEVRVLKRTDEELKVEVVGESHTLLNLVQKELVDDPGVEVGGYDVVHPLEKPVRSVLYIRVRGTRKPEQALFDAIGRAMAATEEFARKFEEALEGAAKGEDE